MIAMVEGGHVVAMCLAAHGPLANQYQRTDATCAAFAKNTLGAVDEPPDYGEQVRAEYARQAAMKHPNGAPKFAPDGTLLNESGNRSICDALRRETNETVP